MFSFFYKSKDTYYISEHLGRFFLARKLKLLNQYKSVPIFEEQKTNTMKAKILFTALLTFLMVNGKAFQQNSTLFIDVMEQPFKTYIVALEDGTTIESERDFKINKVRAGRNGIQIFKRTYRNNGRNQNAFRDQLIYNGIVRVQPNTKVFTELRGRQLITRRVVDKPRNGNFGTYRAMHPQNFAQLKRAVRNESFDRNKIQLLEVAASNNNFTAQQISQLMDLMSFDSYKLTLAKRAYRSTVDPQNYFLVRNRLTFNSYKRQLDQFILKQGNNNAPPRTGNRRR